MKHRRLLPLFLSLIAVAAVYLLIGRYPSPGLLDIRLIGSDPVARRLLLNLRLPRTIAAVLVGASLAVSGTVFQLILSNPLVEPGFLGVSQGAAFGAALAIVATSAAPATIQISAFAFALAGLGGSYLIARSFHYGGWILRLILSGIAVSAVFAALTGLLKFSADPMSELPEITFWLLGGLWSVGWTEVLTIVFPVSIGLMVLFLFRWRLNVLSLDDRTSHSLGTAPKRYRLLLLFAATLATSAAVSISGLIGWAGLMIPHAARRLYGADARSSLPASVALGAIFILVCDGAARTAMPAEIPLGILTSILGAGIFLVIMAMRPTERGG